MIGVPKEDAAAGSGGSINGEAGAAGDGAAAGKNGSNAAAGEGGAATGPCDLVLRGQLLSPGKAPVARAELKLNGEASRSVRTDANGRYELTGLCPGDYTLTPVCFESAIELELDANTTQDFSAEPGNCDEAALAPRVLEVIFDPVASRDGAALQRLSSVLAVDAPDELAVAFADALRAATNGHVQPSPAWVSSPMDFPPLLDGFRYTNESYADCLADTDACHADVAVDYAALEAELSLCDAVFENDADEVWLMGGPGFGFAPLHVLTCEQGELKKKIDLVGLSYERGLTGFLADYQARVDQALVAALGAPELGDNPYGWFTRREGCGGVNMPPNSSEAVFDTRTKATSFCDAFFDYPFGKVPSGDARATDCTAWGCDEIGFRRYWLAHLPRGLWLDDAGRFNDFWRYVLRPEERLELPSPQVTCSSEYLPGWCQNLRDRDHGHCNQGEWATDGKTRGYVELLFRPPQVVTSVTLYDRACDEQVLAGHVEFSNGDDDQKFGELEATGQEPKVVSWDPKLLTGLRIFIDKSIPTEPGRATNPGFGDVSVAATDP